MEYNKKKVYTEEHVAFVRDLVEKGSEVTPATRLMCEKFNLTFDDTIGRSFRNKMQKSGVTNNVVTIEDTDVFKEAQNKQHDTSKQRFLISWAQSETTVHKGFLKNMEAYAEHIDAEILICAGRYRSPTSLSASKSLEAKEKNTNTWDKSVLPYLDANRHNIHKHLVVLSDVKIQPTASNPLSSLNGLTKAESCIVGSPRVHLKSLPVLDGYPNKLLLTTGAVTVENYTDSKIGKLGCFHHQLGFIIVELDGDDFHIRQVVADTKGDFYDLIYRLKDGVCLNNEKGIEAIVLGDLHLPEENKEAVIVSLQMLQKFKPRHVIIHDIIDNGAISHHEKRNPFHLLRRENDGSNSLQKELDYMIDWFRDKTEYNFIIPNANHNDFIDRWLQNEDWRKENNKSLYLEFANITAKGLAPKGIIAYLLEKEYPNIKCLSVDESYKVLDFELSVHGNTGASGSRGSAIQFKNLNVRLITAHTHSSSRMDNHLCAGTLTKLRMGYNIGMSSWIASNVVIYPDGKASHIHIVNNKYTTLF
jgi:hypothetical protein